jgi:hypothetical protein
MSIGISRNEIKCQKATPPEHGQRNLCDNNSTSMAPHTPAVRSHDSSPRSEDLTQKGCGLDLTNGNGVRVTSISPYAAGTAIAGHNSAKLETIIERDSPVSWRCILSVLVYLFGRMTISTKSSSPTQS